MGAATTLAAADGRPRDVGPGRPGRAHVVVEGFAGRCPHCGDAPNQAYDIYISNDVINEVRLPPEHSYLGLAETFIVLEA